MPTVFFFFSHQITERATTRLDIFLDRCIDRTKCDDDAPQQNRPAGLESVLCSTHTFFLFRLSLYVCRIRSDEYMRSYRNTVPNQLPSYTTAQSAADSYRNQATG